MKCLGIQTCCVTPSPLIATTVKPPVTTQIPSINYDNVGCGKSNEEGLLYSMRNNLDVAQFGNLKSSSILISDY